jgi:PhoH-like ATPase
MRKNFVFDTNVLLHDPGAILKFEDNDVIIPIYVIEEIDTFKRDMSELGRNAREISRLLDRFREQGNLGEGVELPDGGLLRVSLNTSVKDPDFADLLGSDQKDNLILRVALNAKESTPERPTILLTKDTNLRLRADALGLEAVNYEERSVSLGEVYAGTCELTVPNSLIDELHKEGSLEVSLDEHEALTEVYEKGEISYHNVERLYLNGYALLRGQEGNQTTFARVSETDDEGRTARFTPVSSQRNPVWSIKPRNKEQLFALDALLDDSINLVTLVGKAGTGKTILAIAAGLRKVTEEQKHHKLLVARPVIPLGRDIGFLPGTMEEKLGPWMRPIFDNVEFLMGLSSRDKRVGRGADELIDMGIIEIEALTFIRGRSLPHQFIIIDEAQNLTPHEAKTILTRVGEGTKIVFTGDPYQIDNPYVDIQSNGLTYVLERFKGQELAATITLTRGERSELAELAANLL